MALASLFFGAAAVIMGHIASDNARGLVINGIIHLGPEGATILMWSIAAMGAVFVAFSVPLMVVGLVSKRRLTLSATELSVPKYGFSRSYTVLRLADIRHMSTHAVNRQRFLRLVHAHGKLTITASLLPSLAVFEELCTEIARRRFAPSQA